MTIPLPIGFKTGKWKRFFIKFFVDVKLLLASLVSCSQSHSIVNLRVGEES